MGFGLLVGWIVSHEAEIDFVAAGGDRVLDDHAIGQFVAEPDELAVGWLRAFPRCAESPFRATRDRSSRGGNRLRDRAFAVRRRENRREW